MIEDDSNTFVLRNEANPGPTPGKMSLTLGAFPSYGLLVMVIDGCSLKLPASVSPFTHHEGVQ